MTKLIECVIVGGDQDGLTFEIRADWPPATVLVPLVVRSSPFPSVAMAPMFGPPAVLPQRRYWLVLDNQNRPSIDSEGRVRYAVP